MEILVPALIGILVPAVTFLIIGMRTSREVKTVNHYFIFPGQATSRRLYSSFMAASLSMASAILVFIDWGSTPGIGAAALYSPALWAAGIGVLYLLFSRMLPHLSEYRTLHGFLGHSYGDDGLRKVASVATLMGFLGQLGVEILVGTALLRVAETTFQLEIAYFVLGAALLAIVISYSWMGGFLSVLKSDRIQYRLVVLAISASIIFVVSRAPVEVANMIHASLADDLLAPGFGWLTVISLACLNLPLLVTDMSVWQRLASMDDPEEAQASISSFGQGLLYIGAAITLLGLSFQVEGLLPIPEGASAMSGLVLYLSESPLLLTLLFAGVFAAIMSTADSFLLAASQAWLTDFKGIEELRQRDRYDQEEAGERDHELLRLARHTNLRLGCVTFVVCYALQLGGVDFISLLFAVFAAQISLAPAVVFGLLKGGEEQGALSRYAAKARMSVIVGYSAVVLASAVTVGLIQLSSLDPDSIKNYALWTAPVYVTVLSWGTFLLIPASDLSSRTIYE